MKYKIVHQDENNIEREVLTRDIKTKDESFIELYKIYIIFNGYGSYSIDELTLKEIEESDISEIELRDYESGEITYLSIVKEIDESEQLLIINTGGTFNKKYNQLNGDLEILENNNNILEIINNNFKGNFIENIDFKVLGKFYIDSLEMTDENRERLVNLIIDTKSKQILIVHGTDKMNETAIYIDKRLKELNIKNKTIVLTGPMIPYPLDKVEATSNFSIGFLALRNNFLEENKIYISMHGLIDNFRNIKKDFDVGIFKKQ
jgi:L-asparaginase